MWQRDGGTFSDSPSIIHEQLGSGQETGQNLETVRRWGDLLMWDVWLGEIASLHLIFVPLCAWLYRQVRPLTYALHSLRQYYCSGTLTLGQFHGACVKAQMVGPDHSQQSSLLAVEGMLFRCKTEVWNWLKVSWREKKKGWDKEIILSVFLEMDVKVVPFVVIINQQTCNNKKKLFLASHDIIILSDVFKSPVLVDHDVCRHGRQRIYSHLRIWHSLPGEWVKMYRLPKLVQINYPSSIT